MARHRSIPPVPPWSSGEMRATLRDLRDEAVAADQRARSAENDARQVRARADVLLRRYVALIEEQGGTLDDILSETS